MTEYIKNALQVSWMGCLTKKRREVRTLTIISTIISTKINFDTKRPCFTSKNGPKS